MDLNSDSNHCMSVMSLKGLNLYQRLPDKEPTSFETVIFKWIFIPVLVYGLYSTFSSVSDGREKCENICYEKGYHDVRYKPSGRYNIEPESCHCLTEEESNVKTRIPKGTPVF